MATVNGEEIKHIMVYPEGNLWRWEITDRVGRDYVDGGNYTSPQDALSGAIDAID